MTSSEFTDLQVTPEMRTKIAEKSQTLFQSLFDDYKVESKEDTIILLNSALCFMCMIQNSFYPYENREDFADSISHAMKQNKGEPPKKEESKPEL